MPNFNFFLWEWATSKINIFQINFVTYLHPNFPISRIISSSLLFLHFKDLVRYFLNASISLLFDKQVFLKNLTHERRRRWRKMRSTCRSWTIKTSYFWPRLHKLLNFLIVVIHEYAVANDKSIVMRFQCAGSWNAGNVRLQVGMPQTTFYTGNLKRTMVNRTQVFRFRDFVWVIWIEWVRGRVLHRLWIIGRSSCSCFRFTFVISAVNKRTFSNTFIIISKLLKENKKSWKIMFEIQHWKRNDQFWTFT